MTADAAHVAAVAEALLATWRVGDDLTSQAMAFQASRRDATVAVETLTPLIRAQVAADMDAAEPCNDDCCLAVHGYNIVGGTR